MAGKEQKKRIPADDSTQQSSAAHPQAVKPTEQTENKAKTGKPAATLPQAEVPAAEPRQAKTKAKAKPAPLPQAEGAAAEPRPKSKPQAAPLPQAEEEPAEPKDQSKKVLKKQRPAPRPTAIQDIKESDGESEAEGDIPREQAAPVADKPEHLPEARQSTTNKTNLEKKYSKQKPAPSSAPKAGGEHKHGSVQRRPESARPAQPPPKEGLPLPSDLTVERQDDTDDLEQGGEDFGDDYDPDNDAAFWGDPAHAGERTVTSEDFVTNDEEEDLVLERVIKSSAKTIRLKEYKWAKSTLDFVQIPTKFQDLNPMSSAERRELLKETPSSFAKAFPCKGLTSLGEERKYVNVPSELWWLEKAAPKLHLMMREELRALMFFVQECGEDKERLGLQTEEMLNLLKTVITLHVDTMKMIAAMQRQRAWKAMERDDPDGKQEDPEQQIISDKQKDAERKKVEQRVAFEMGKGRSFLQQVTSNFKKRKAGPFRQSQSQRRPRHSGGGRGRAQATYEQSNQETFLPSKSFRGRGRGRGGRGRGGRGRGRGSRGRGHNFPQA